MKKFRAIFLMIAASILLYGCPSDDYEKHQYITIVNRSDSEITVQEVWSLSINPTDTLWVCGIPALTIEPNSSRMFESGNAHRGKSWEDDLKRIPFIQFSIFDAAVYDSLKNYDIPCSQTNYTIPVMHYYQLKLEDLQRMNWEVVYPPIEK